MSDNVREIASTQRTIAPGSTVRLKSGGPTMTVIDRGLSWAYVAWAKDDGNDIQRDWVPLSGIEAVKP